MLPTQQTKAAKRAKTNSSKIKDSAPDLYALYSGDLAEIILSYASTSDICTLETLSKRFQSLMANQWKIRTEDRFGMNNSKEGWKVCVALLRKPIYIHIDDGGGDDGYWEGTIHAAANGSVVAIVSEDSVEDDNGVGIFNAHSLDYTRTIPSQTGGCRVAICGREESETIVIASSTCVRASRSNYVQTWRNMRGNPNGTPMIGCDTHLIAAVGTKEIELYKVNEKEGSGTRDEELLSLTQTVIMPSNERNDVIRAISWANNKAQFVVCCGCQISVFGFDPDQDRMSLTQTINVDAGLTLVNASLSDDYIVGASEDKKLHVWNRSNGGKKHVLCDVDEAQRLEFEYCYHPLSMSCFGHMLVTTSNIGCALCVWNVRTGQLLKRYNDADEERNVDMLPDGIDATDMVYLERLNGFFCTSGGFMNVWAFPTNEIQRIAAIRRQGMEK